MDKNIYEKEASYFTPEMTRSLINQLKSKGFTNIIIFNDKLNDEFIKVESLLQKEIDKANYKLDNPDDSTAEKMRRVEIGDDEKNSMFTSAINKLKANIMVQKLKAIELDDDGGDENATSKLELEDRLKRMWHYSCALGLKIKGKVAYCIIPEDMLMRMYSENKVKHDLLDWIMNMDKLVKVKLNQILMHIAALTMQQTGYDFEGQGQDLRVGLDINKVCKANNKYFKVVSEVIVAILLSRHIIELILYQR